MKKRIKDTAISMVIILFFVFTVLFYGPLSLYLPNAEEMWFRIGPVWKTISVVSLAAFIVMSVFFLILPEKAQVFFRKLLFGGALGAYVQGNLLAVNYGVMDGSKVDWSAYKTYAVINTLIWAACILLPFLVGWFVRKKKGMITRILVTASLFLTAIQLPAMAVQLMTYHPNENAALKISKDGMFEVSQDENIVILMLDTMDEQYYQSFVELNPEYTDALTGFVHYENTLTSGARTIIAVPSMFTGQPFRKEETYSAYLNDVWSKPNSFSRLHDAGYTVKIYSDTVLFSTDTAEYVENFSDEGGQIGSYKTFAKKLYKLDLSKFAPHVMKKRFWFSTSEFNQAKKETDEYVVDDLATVKAYRKSGLIINDKLKKNLLFLHMHGAHAKFTMGRDGRKGTDLTRMDQITGCMGFVAEVLQNMKDLGIYDSSTIIIMADHGHLNVAEWPFFLVKEAGATEPYRTSKAPVSLFDLNVYLSKLAGVTIDDDEYGVDFTQLSEDAERERHVFVNQTGNSHVFITEYMTRSYAGDLENLVAIDEFRDDVNVEEYELGTYLSFTTDATANCYCMEGFGMNTGFRTRMYGPYARYDIPIKDLPSEGSLNVHFDLYTKYALPFTLKANGVDLDDSVSMNGEKKKEIDFEVPVSVFKDTNVLSLEFYFPSIPENEMEIDNIEDRTSSLSLTGIIIDEK